jgi:hypothetical protein
MTLSDFVIVPGVVIYNSDPLNQGRVKACAPGLFDTATMKVEEMLWINPFCMTGQQTFSKMHVNSKIWILHNKNNYFEYWYIPMFEVNENAPQNGNSDADVLFARSVGGQSVQMYYSANAGTQIKNGDAGVQIKPSGDATLGSGNASVDCSADGSVNIGGDGDKYHVVKGEYLVELLESLAADFSTISNACYATPMLNPVVGETFNKMANDVLTNAKNILSDSITIS